MGRRGDYYLPWEEPKRPAAGSMWATQSVATPERNWWGDLWADVTGTEFERAMAAIDEGEKSGRLSPGEARNLRDAAIDAASRGQDDELIAIAIEARERNGSGGARDRPADPFAGTGAAIGEVSNAAVPYVAGAGVVVLVVLGLYLAVLVRR